MPNFGPAQVVVISDPLTNTLDWTTLQLTEVDFGSQFFAIPQARNITNRRRMSPTAV
ncbi:MAG: hypothetical protein NT154_21655 [Verrucomicrobia bacterium]|nr:hypothetical protein [Verrucomicrobiota bacterium]